VAGVTAGTERAPGPGGRAAGRGGDPRQRIRGRRNRAWRRGGLAVAAAAGAGLLFLAYLRVSWTVAATADGAAQALQARDMLAGNWLLHGWTLSDVSFYTTELPEYVLVELVRPLGPGVIHVAAALTYTLLVLAAGALARGRADGRAGAVRGVLAAAIMLAPQLGYGAFVLLLSADHTGTQVPLLLGWLLLDLAAAPGSRLRRWAPAAICLLLAWVQVADRVAVLTGVLPLVLVCAVRVLGATATARRAGCGRWWRAGRLERALGLAAVASTGVAWAAARLLAAAGGFTAHPLPFTLAPARLLGTHAWLTGWGVLEVYGANFVGVRGWAGLAGATLHLAGLALAVAGTGLALRSFLRRGSSQGSRARGGERDSIVDSVLAVAVVANLVSYLLSVEPGTVLGTGYDAREIAAVLPLGAVLAGRQLGPRLAGRLWTARGGHSPSINANSGNSKPDFRPGELGGSGKSGPGQAKRRLHGGPAAFLGLAFALGIAGYASALGCAAAQPAAAGPDTVLAGWLAGHGLRYGLGGASANLVTVDSGGRVTVATVAVTSGRVRPHLYQAAAGSYDPRRRDATFLVAAAPPARAGDAAEVVPAAAVRATFGPPARVYRFAGFAVDVWGVNLLTKMHG
jgi:hypothetical protein